MKKVLLIGDSVADGYQQFIGEAFSGVAEVLRSESARFAQYTLRQIPDWKRTLKAEDADVVHWNTGLWDVAYIQDGEILTPIEIYEMYIERICKLLKLQFPKAKFIFATSTPVIESRYSSAFYRKNEDIIRYNEVAVKIAKEHSMEINDLYSLTKNCGEEYYVDATHMYTKQGGELLVNAVIKSIAPHIGIDADKLNYKPDYTPPKWFLGV